MPTWSRGDGSEARRGSGSGWTLGSHLQIRETGRRSAPFTTGITTGITVDITTGITADITTGITATITTVTTDCGGAGGAGRDAGGPAEIRNGRE